MALPILDGNQTATTLSTVLTSGEHIPAHTVVSLGSVAISNITSAVSGSVVSVSNFPSTQTIVGTVTANVDFAGANGATAPAKVVPIGYIDTLNTGNLAHVGTDSGQGLPARIDEVHVYGVGYTRFPNWLDGNGGPNVPISGTVTANVKGIWSGDSNLYDLPVLPGGEFGNGTRIPVSIVDSQGNTIGIGADGADRFSVDANITNTVTIGSLPTISGTVTANTAYAVNVTGIAGFAAGTVTAIPVALVDRGVYGGNLLGYNGTNTYLNTAIESVGGNSLRAGGTFPVSGSVTVSNFPASTTVTVSALPSGALTTRFGSVATANLAFITSAVTNTSRKYLLAQNISAGTVTIGIGFSPTTTQGIQLTAGAGLTFDAFCPTGAVYWLGAVTGAAFTILEG